MFGQKSTRKINLHLPTSWNLATTEELEIIAAAIISEQQRVDRYHPFDWSRVKLSVVLGVNHIEVVSQPVPVIKNYSHDDTYLVRRSKDEEPWPVSVGQLVALTERLAWLDDEKTNKTIFRFPYPELTLVHGSGFMVQGSKRKVHSLKSFLRPDGSKRPKAERTINREPLTVAGPPPLLDGYTWREYRWLTDWMQAYMRHSNAKNAEGAAQAQREFLAILFKPAEKPTGTGAAEHTSDISHLTSDIFEGFSPIKWQVILFWWSSLMSILAKKFPKVFKQQSVGKDKRRQQRQDTPWDFYNRVTATIQKYIGGLSEQDVNNATYGTILQQLEMMADEAAEMEKLKKK